MAVTAYLNSNILNQEAAISIEEKAIKAKKAALNLRKAVDRKVVRAINNIREAIEKYPEYLEIIRNEFTNTKVDTQKEEDIKIIEEEALWPKVSVIPKNDGSLISMPIEDMTPLLQLQELRQASECKIVNS